jgi:ribosomal protein S18 acetylase RimI-like enzyme
MFLVCEKVNRKNWLANTHYNMQKAFEILTWDSDFFNFKVARIKENIDPDNDKTILKDLFEKDITLVYYSSPGRLQNFENSFYSIAHVDQKVTYIKDITDHQNDHRIKSYKKNYPEKKLIDLAISSGVYSRFNMDKKIGRKNFEDLYTHWIIKSVAREIADEVLVYRDNNKIRGFVTTGKKNNRADIGIIAVDAAYRGKGIGKALMFEAEKFYYNKLDTIQVVTQRDNLPASRLYESCGYTLEKAEHFYHLWRKNGD